MLSLEQTKKRKQWRWVMNVKGIDFMIRGPAIDPRFLSFVAFSPENVHN